MWELKSDLPNRQLEHLYLRGGGMRKAVGEADMKRCDAHPSRTKTCCDSCEEIRRHLWIVKLKERIWKYHWSDFIKWGRFRNSSQGISLPLLQYPKRYSRSAVVCVTSLLGEQELVHAMNVPRIVPWSQAPCSCLGWENRAVSLRVGWRSSNTKG